MPSPEPPRDAPKSLTDDVTVTAPRIVNGLTVRPRKPVNLWYYGLGLLPDFMTLLVVVYAGANWLARYLDTKRKNPARLG
jgi:hypothetical protein